MSRNPIKEPILINKMQLPVYANLCFNGLFGNFKVKINREIYKEEFIIFSHKLNI